MLKNSAVAKIYYGLHFYPGVAEYRDQGIRVLVNEDAIRKMNSTFQGKPVFVGHVDDEIENMSLDELKKISDGTVIRSFYNEADGKTWVEFVINTEKGIDAIENKGWRLSNAYKKTASIPGHGLWNGVDYAEEITDGVFHHLAVVSNPRYAESIILTPEQFKTYNESKKAELIRLQNSLEKKEQEKPMVFNLFKKTKLENGLDLDGITVQLPKAKREVALVDLINEANVEMKEIKDQIIVINEANDERMTINEAVQEIINLRNECDKLKEELKNACGKKNEEDEKDKKKENEDDGKEDDKKKENEDAADDKDKKKENEDKEDDKKKENEDDEDQENEDDKKKEDVSKNFLNELLNANQLCDFDSGEVNILLPSDRAELGRKYY